jgi:aspartate ammonia-lyase
MRKERDFLGEVSIEGDALYGIHSLRAAANFPGNEPFHREWYRAVGKVKLACYHTLSAFESAAREKYPHLMPSLKIPDKQVIHALINAATEVAEGEHYEHFIVPALQGGAGTSINLNINEIIANRALLLTGRAPGDYAYIDPIETANIYQSTNDVIPTSLRVAVMELLEQLEAKINGTRAGTEQLEKRYRDALRVSYTQMQEAVPGTFGLLFSTYNDAFSRDWWRVSKAFERIKQINLGGGATGTGLSIPRFFIMEAGNALRKLTGLPLAQGENLTDITANQDAFVEVHAILKAHAVNLEKMAGDLRLLSSGIAGEREIDLPERQTGSSIMPGKVNPVIPEYVISSAQRIYSSDQHITSLAGQGCLELNAYLPSIGHQMIDTLKVLIAANQTVSDNILNGLVVHEEVAAGKLFRSPAITTALSPVIGYHAAAELAKTMKMNRWDIFRANEEIGSVPAKQLKRLLSPAALLKKGFTLMDIDDIRKEID